MADFKAPTWDDLGAAPAAAPKPPAAPATPGFSAPSLQDFSASPSVMQFYDPAQKRIVPPTEGFSTTLSPFGLDTGIPMGEGLSRYLAGYGSELMNKYRGAKDIGLGAASMAPGSVGEWARQQRAKLAGDVAESRRLDPELGRDVSGGIGEATAGMHLMGPFGSERLWPTIAGGALYGGLEQRTSDESHLLGAGAGALGGALGYGATGLGGKLVQSAGGSLIPQWMRPYTGALGALPKEIQDKLDLAAAKGIPVRAGDVSGSPAIIGMESAAEAIPGSGMEGFLDRQIDATKRYFTNLNDRLGNRYGGQETTAAVNGVLNTYQKNQKANNKLYDKVDQVANAAKFKTNVTTQELAPALGRLQTLDNNFWTRPFVTDDVKPLLAGIADGSISRLSFDQWNQVKRALGGMQSVIQKQEQSGLVPGELSGAAQQAYKAAMADAERWGKNVRNTKVKAAYDAASNDFKENIVPFEDPANDLLNKIVYGKFDTTEYANLGNLFTEGGAQRLQQLTDWTDAGGKRALDNLLKRKVAGPTVGESKMTGVEPVAAARAYDALSPQARTMLPAGSKEALDYARLGNIVRRTGAGPDINFMEQRLPHALALSALIGAPVLGGAAGYMAGDRGVGSAEMSGAGALAGLAGALGAGRGMTALSTTKPGMRFLLSPSTVIKGAPLSGAAVPFLQGPLETLSGNR